MGLRKPQQDHCIKEKWPLSTFFSFFKKKSVFCTRDKCVFYALFRLEKKLSVWYFIVRKGDTDVQVNQKPNREREIPQGSSWQLIWQIESQMRSKVSNQQSN